VIDPFTLEEVKEEFHFNLSRKPGEMLYLKYDEDGKATDEALTINE
jgi:hypothetical protein